MSSKDIFTHNWNFFRAFFDSSFKGHLNPILTYYIFIITFICIYVYVMNKLVTNYSKCLCFFFLISDYWDQNNMEPMCPI